jgi:hypothetical protein
MIRNEEIIFEMKAKIYTKIYSRYSKLKQKISLRYSK